MFAEPGRTPGRSLLIVALRPSCRARRRGPFFAPRRPLKATPKTSISRIRRLKGRRMARSVRAFRPCA